MVGCSCKSLHTLSTSILSPWKSWKWIWWASVELHSPQSLLYPDGVCFAIQSSKHCDLVFINIWSPGDKENGGQFWYTISIQLRMWFPAMGNSIMYLLEEHYIGAFCLKYLNLIFCLLVWDQLNWYYITRTHKPTLILLWQVKRKSKINEYRIRSWQERVWIELPRSSSSIML